ncbi:MAG: SMI1/KNR4 family protein [Planctomycetes bacterium]|nr:SMI1/KNR4 family protein [Planctomycetota bacterium]
MNQIQQLIARWTVHGIKCPPGASLDDIAAFESRHNVRLPHDLRSYFLAVNGTGERHTLDDDLFCFWPLSDVISIAEDLPDRCSGLAHASRYFIIADHSICLPSYAIRLSADPAAANPVASVFVDPNTLAVEDMFESFTDFVQHYLDDPFETGGALPSNIPILDHPTWLGRVACFAKGLLHLGARKESP